MVEVIDQFAELWNRASAQEKKQIKELIEKSENTGNTRTHRAQAKELLAFLNRKAGKKFQEVDVNINPIMERLRAGATVEQCRAVIANRVAKWGEKEETREWLRPATIFNKTKFANYLGEIG